VHWQSLYHPACLDPLELGPEVRQLTLKEEEIMTIKVKFKDERT
jgi:hypothetical protein